MGQYDLPGQPSVPLTLRRSARALRISLRVSQLDGRVTLTLPKGVSESEALKFAHEKADWIRSHLQNQVSSSVVALGSEIPIEGHLRHVVPAQGRRVVLDVDEVAVPEDAVARRLERFLKERARDRLLDAADYYADVLGKSYTKVTLRDTRSRWGSCSSQGALMFSWRLILAPPGVLQYVAAHEVAHLAEMNHSEKFWAQVERIHGPYSGPRHWLRSQGSTLHQYRFE
ncbi:M48 family metallopeptidase [Ruegeria litorea]|uniref:M48 family metallopeptidase n=1 Tax=Falsiruegeria litorea TaxID=1280831 RepID=A0ABS5WLQ1_9RHOB|nr:SprT family zinc-dependent metalloprotease [Falsiruegeria litorea]MBT3140064.1 M48 family metallopeptidase [Falsiruegeria litorea]